MNPWSRWVGWLSLREPATSVAICRIVTGSAVFYQIASAWRCGAADAMWVDARWGGVRALDRPGALAWFGGATPGHVHAFAAVGLVFAGLMTVGLLGDLATLGTWFVFRTLAGLNDHSGGSGDDLVVNILFLLIWSRSSRGLSIDARWFGWRGDVPAWPRFALILQLVILYEATAFQKVSAGWVPWGSLDALWYILQQPTWQRTSMTWLAPAYRLTQLATLTTWLFEHTAWLLLVAFWFRATRDRPGRVRAWFNRVDVRRAYLALGLVLHLGIAIAMDVGPFLPGIVALYACCFTPREWASVFRRLHVVRRPAEAER